MKKTIILILFFLPLISLFSCAQQTTKIPPQTPQAILPSPEAQPPPPAIIPMTQDIVPVPTEKSPSYGDILSHITTSTASFNPSQKEEVGISFTLSQEALVTLNIYDPDHGLINTIKEEAWKTPGKHTLVWAGKDLNGAIVPDEAYYFTITAKDKNGKEEIYDPAMFSGGVEQDIINVDIDKENQTINYRMPQMGRVLVRIGTQGGPLLRTLVDWQPRVAGAITEYWDGWDQENLIRVIDHPNFKMIVTYFILPDNSVITYGNNKTTYREYKKEYMAKQPLKPERPHNIDQGRVSYHYTQLRTNDYSPKIHMTFPNAVDTDKDGVPVLKDKTLARVELAEKDTAYFAEQKYEICFFLDTEFYAEEEVGYSPFNWTWNLQGVEEGEHILTVNLSGFKDQIGILSKKIKVVK